MLLVAAVAAIAVVAGSSYFVVGRSRTPGIVVGQGSDRLPSESLTDWVTYGDHVVVATIETERALPVSDEALGRGEGLIGRRMTARVASTLWSRSGAAPLPSSLDLLVWGWVLQEGRRLPFTSEGSPRPVVGDTYVVPVTQVAGGEWVLLAPSAIIPVSEGVMHAPPAKEVGVATPIARGYDGRPVDVLSKVLQGTTPDPAAQPFMKLDPDQRWASVIASHPPTKP